MGREYDMTQTGLSLGIDIGSTTAKAVLVEDYITPVNAMEQLYMTVYVE